MLIVGVSAIDNLRNLFMRNTLCCYYVDKIAANGAEIACVLISIGTRGVGYDCQLVGAW